MLHTIEDERQPREFRRSDPGAGAERHNAVGRRKILRPDAMESRSNVRCWTRPAVTGPRAQGVRELYSPLPARAASMSSYGRLPPLMDNRPSDRFAALCGPEAPRAAGGFANHKPQ
jgi:hypothetical protein